MSKKGCKLLHWIYALCLVLIPLNFVVIMVKIPTHPILSDFYAMNIVHSITSNQSMANANCSMSWRKQYQTQILDASFFFSLDLFDRKLFENNTYYHYQYLKVPKGTFTYWLSHIEAFNRLEDKAYFADKYLMKQYVDDYKAQYPQFESIRCAQILFDFNSTEPSMEQIASLKHLHKGFLVKPNHFSGQQIIINKEDSITEREYHRIIKQTRRWRKLKYSQKSNRINRESWYQLIQPRIYIEEHLFVDNVNDILEYKFWVFNGKALFARVKQHGLVMNFYLLPQWNVLNVTWGVWEESKRDANVKPPPRQHFDIMMAFAEHFAQREQFNFVRVDLYESHGRIYFSEFTFAPGDGTGVLWPISFDYLLYNILCDDETAQINRLGEYT